MLRLTWVGALTRLVGVIVVLAGCGQATVGPSSMALRATPTSTGDQLRASPTTETQPTLKPPTATVDLARPTATGPAGEAPLHGFVYCSEQGLEELADGRTRLVVGWSSIGAAPQGMSVSRDGRMLAYSRSGQDLWVMDLATRHSRQVISHPLRAELDDVLYSSWSPDGAWLALWLTPHEEGTPTDHPVRHPERDALHTIRVATGEAYEIAQEGTDSAWVAPGGDIAFQQTWNEPYGIFVCHPDGSGRRLVYAPATQDTTFEPFMAASPRDGRLLVVETTLAGLGTGTMTMTTTMLAVSPLDGSRVDVLPERSGARLMINWPAWSPDGSQVAFGGIDGLQILDLKTGAVRLLAGGLQGPLAWSPDGSLLAAMTLQLEPYFISAHDGHVVGRLPEYWGGPIFEWH